MLAFAIRAALEDSDGRLYGRAGAERVSIAIAGGELQIIAVGENERWTGLRHVIDTRKWYAISGKYPDRKRDVRQNETELVKAMGRPWSCWPQLSENDVAGTEPPDWPVNVP